MTARGVISVLLGGMAACLVFATAPVSAAVKHERVSAFDVSGIIVYGLAVDNSAGPSRGAVYVATLNNSEESVVYKYPAGGGATPELTITGAGVPGGFSLFAFPQTPGVAVDSSAGPSKGDVYVADREHGVVDRFSESGVYLSHLTGAETKAESMAPTGVAVNASGDVYVGDAANDVIDEFDPTGKLLAAGSFEDPMGTPGSLAVNTAGDILVSQDNVESAGSSVFEFEPGGTLVLQPALEESHALGVAADAVDGHVFADEASGGIGEFAFTGGVAEKLDVSGNSGFALAVDSVSHDIYTTNTFAVSNEVEVFGPDVVTPDVSTHQGSSVTETAATLNGVVTPDSAHGGGEVTECRFEYVTETQFTEHGYAGAGTLPCSPATPYAVSTPVSATVSLSPSTTYQFRVVAGDPGIPPALGGSDEGASVALTTSGRAGTSGETATVEPTSAVVHAQVDPFGLQSSCEVQYVSDAAFKTSGYAGAATVPCSPGELAPGFSGQVVSAQLSGLSVATSYHYRFVAANTAGTTDGADETFTTFGVESFKLEDLNAEGQPDTQAGAHPYKLVTTFQLNGSVEGNLKDVQAELPPGLFGNVTALPRCTRAELVSHACSGAAQVGLIDVYEAGHQSIEKEAPLYNIVPPAGVPGEFGARLADKVDVFIDANVRPGGDYGVIAGVNNASTAAGVSGSKVELWGVPAEQSHNVHRYCPVPNPKEPGAFQEQPNCAAGMQARPFLTNPTLCAGQQTASLRVDAWQDAGAFTSATATLPPFTGCNRLIFPPSISVLPDTSASDSPSGVSVALQVPQNNEVPEALSTPSLQNAVVTLPAGMTLNPADANGLQACSPAQIGLDSSAEATCPDASKVGSVEIETPLLSDKLTGSVYLAAQDNNPFDSTFALYVTAEADGALIKVAGHVEPNVLTGQLTTTFDDNPQLPFSSFKLHFFGGPRAPLATPKECGTYTTTSELTPWSTLPGGPPSSDSGPAATATPSSPFQITTGPEGAPCATPGFAPSFTAGTTSNSAGGFTPFTLTMGRGDGEQNLGTITTKMPPGVVGMLAKVPLCGEPQAGEGTCPVSSQIGHVTVGVGAGNYPLQVPEPGKPQDPVYLTGPYKGAPFGLSVVVPAEAGPFNLDENGKPVVVRATIQINPATAQVTVASDPVPQILQGVPLDVRLVNVTIDRPEFIVNPTNCNPLAIEASLTSGLGTPATLSAPLQATRTTQFQATNCAALKFTPKFAVSTSGKTTKVNGASLTTKLVEPPGALGTQANISLVKVELPKQLPSRLTTLQKACLASVFNANPANCPAASLIGHAKVITPLLPVPLEGPAIFVSHGGEAFPSLTMVLQGYGVTVDLVGTTFIDKHGVTSTTFKTVPDTPFNTFELTLPQGKFSALGANLPAKANGSFCGQHLVMPTEFVAQNGAVIHQQTPLAVTGCAKAKTRAQLYAAALKACHKKKRAQRAACQRAARKKYGPLKKPKK